MTDLGPREVEMDEISEGGVSTHGDNESNENNDWSYQSQKVIDSFLTHTQQTPLIIL